MANLTDNTSELKWVGGFALMVGILFGYYLGCHQGDVEPSVRGLAVSFVEVVVGE
jgi:hypothetical protein